MKIQKIIKSGRNEDNSEKGLVNEDEQDHGQPIF
jgi:hypothetical protein